MILNLDYETYSACDIRKAGTYRYAADPTTEILMLAWAIGNEPINLWEPHREPVPTALVDLLRNRGVVKRAFNAAFERQITKHCLGIDVPIEQWQCSQAASLSLGFPAHLDGVLAAVGLGQKDKRGARLIQTFSTPNPKNWKLRRCNWDTHPDEWQEFRLYCRRDVEVERNLWQWIESKPVTIPWQDWWLDQMINAAGLPFDVDMGHGAERLLTKEKHRIKQALEDITGLDKITRGPMLHWLAERGLFLPNTQRDTLERMPREGISDELREVTSLWTEYQTRAGDKFKAGLRSEIDGWLYGVFQFRGAARTGRWAGRIIQPHNLKSTLVAKEEVGLISAAVTAGDALVLREKWPEHSVSSLIGSAVRHAVKAPEGQTFAVCDWSSIESRVLGWLANCRLINQTFAAEQDTYKVFAAQYFGVGYEQITKQQRTFAKPPTLGCGYQLGVEGLIKYAEGYGVALSPEESERAVSTFRNMYPEVPAFWRWVEDAVKSVILNGPRVEGYRLSLWRDSDFLYIRLPSGRQLCYYGPAVLQHKTPWGEDRLTISYMGVDQYTGQWTRQWSHGGKLTENIVQAIAADVLMDGIRALAPQLRIVLHVHDEIAAMVPITEGEQALTLMKTLMSQSPLWAPDLLLAAEGWVGNRYAKF